MLNSLLVQELLWQRLLFTFRSLELSYDRWPALYGLGLLFFLLHLLVPWLAVYINIILILGNVRKGRLFEFVFWPSHRSIVGIVWLATEVISLCAGPQSLNLLMSLVVLSDVRK